MYFDFTFNYVYNNLTGEIEEISEPLTSEPGLIQIIVDFCNTPPFVVSSNSEALNDIEFLEDGIVNNRSLTENDLLIAKCNGEIVGAKNWMGEYTDIPVMGIDGHDETIEYCNEASAVMFKIYKSSTNTMIELEGEYPKWSNLNNFVVNNLYQKTILPQEYKINNPYPNPFNPVINVEIEIPEDQSMKIYIYDIRGRLVERLFENKPLKEGYHTIRWDASNFSSGIYFMKFEGMNTRTIKKVTLLK